MNHQYLDSRDAEPVSIRNYERWSLMGRPDLVRPLLDSLTTRAQRLIDSAKKRNGVMTDSEERELEQVMDEAQNAKTLVKQAEEARQRILLKYPEMWRPEKSETSPEWEMLSRGMPTRLSIPVGNGLRKRTFKNGRIEVRDITVSSNGTVPTLVYETLLARLVLQSGVLQSNVRMISTERGENILMPRLTAYGTATLTSEGATFNESDPTLSSITMGAYKYTVFTQVSDEMIADSAYNMENEIGKALGVAIGTAISSALCTGSGTAQPEGIFTATTVGVTSSTAVSGAITSVSQVLSLYASLPAQYRTGASFVMAPATYASIVALNDTTGRSLVLPDLTSSQPLQMLGCPVYLDDNAPATATNAKSIYFGNLEEHFAIRMVNTVEVASSTDYAFVNGLVTLRAQLRIDSKAINSDAARVFKGAST